jgi:protein O-GlcNAc transferase
MDRTTSDPELEHAREHRKAGRPAEAYALCEQVLAQDPEHAEALFLLGLLDLEAARPERAVERLEHAVRLAPQSALYLTNLGLARAKLGQLVESAEALAHAVRLAPELTAALRNLGLVLCDLGDFVGGLEWLERASAREPKSAAARCLVAKALVRAGRVGEAMAHFERALSLSAQQAELCLDFLPRLAQGGYLAQAAEVAGRAVRLSPTLARAHVALGRAEAARSKDTEAVESFRRAIALEGRLALTLGAELALALLKLGRLEDSVAAHEHALGLDPTLASTEGNLVFLAAYRPAFDAQQILATARTWGERHAPPRADRQASPARDRSPERRLRLGYVSPDFRDHVQRFFVLPVFREHDHSAFELVGYSSVKRPDEWTARMRDEADTWHDVSRLDDGALAEKIRRDQIDVLIDLTMHMPGSRLKAFAERPAPVQISWLAYPGTTGTASIDHRITDPLLDPPGLPLPYSERSLWLPRSFWCYDPLDEEPAVKELPALTAGHITFGCLNNFIKVNRGTLELWARVLTSVPHSRLLLLAPPGWARSHATEVLRAGGVAPSRVDFVDRQSRHDYLATHHRIDVALDCSPYNGHTTSLDAFWMGVPVVTAIGSTVVGRAGLSMASNLDLHGLVAKNEDEYVKIASELTGSLPLLNALRLGMRRRMRDSPLMDASGFTRDLEGAYRAAWREFCAKPSAAT